MELLKQRIQREGVNMGHGILKVDSFINHQVDPALMLAVGGALAARFAHLGADSPILVPLVQPPYVVHHIHTERWPIPRFSVRLEAQGAQLLRLNQVIAATSEGLVTAELTDGYLTLADLQQRFGQEAVSLADYLYDECLVELTEP